MSRGHWHHQAPPPGWVLLAGARGRMSPRRALALTALMAAATLLPTSPDGPPDALQAPRAVVTGSHDALVAVLATGAPVVQPRRERATLSRSARSRRSAPNFRALALCESSGRPTAVSRTGKYRGLYQFDRATWAQYGPAGDPAQASPAEQTRRALALYRARGPQPWPHCGRLL